MSLITSQKTRTGAIEDSNSAHVVPDDVGADAGLGNRICRRIQPRRGAEVGGHEDEGLLSLRAATGGLCGWEEDSGETAPIVAR